MKAIKILVSAPSDQTENVNSVLEAVEEYSDLMRKRGLSFECLHWQKNIAGGRAERPQDVINVQVKDVDVIIAVIGTRMGTDTGKAESGTAEEVFDFCKKEGFKNNPFNTNIFFQTKFDGDVSTLDPQQLQKVQNFKKTISDMGILFIPFSTSKMLEKLVRTALDSFYYQSEQTSEQALNDDDDEQGLDEFFEQATEDLSDAVETLSEITHGLSEFASEMDEAKKFANNENKFLKAGITAMNTLAEKIASKVDRIQEKMDSAYSNSLSGTKILIEDFDKNINRKDIENLTKSLDEMINAGLSGAAEMNSLEQTIKNIPRRNSQLIKARKKILNPISKLKITISNFNNNMRIIHDNMVEFID